MTNIDPKQAERVWSRVMGASCQMHSAMPQPIMQRPAAQQETQTCLDEQTLMELVTQAQSTRAAYCRLSCMTRGCAQRTLQRLANQKAQQIRKLAAVYYIRTGKKLCPAPAAPPCMACFAEALREQHMAAKQAEARYAQLSQCAPDDACLLEQLAKEECRAAEELYQVLAGCL